MLFSCQVMSDSLRPCELQRARPPVPHDLWSLPKLNLPRLNFCVVSVVTNKLSLVIVPATKYVLKIFTSVFSN